MTSNKIHEEKDLEVVDQIIYFSDKYEPGEVILDNKVIIIGQPVFIDGNHNEEEVLRDAIDEAIGLVVRKNLSKVLIDVETSKDEVFNDNYLYIILIEELEELKDKYDLKKFDIYFLKKEAEVDEELALKIFKYLQYDDSVSSVSFDITSKKDFEAFAEKEKRNPNEVPMRFGDYLLSFLSGDDSGSKIYAPAHVSRFVFSKIINSVKYPNYRPTKETVLALAIGLRLNMDEAQKFVHVAGYHIGTYEMTDLIVRYFINNKIYNMNELEAVLEHYGLDILGEKTRNDIVR